MKLNRRQLLKGLAAGAVVIGAPKIVQEGLIQVEDLWKSKTISIPKNQIIFAGDKFYLDYATKSISINPHAEKATVLELHRWLQDQADQMWTENTMLDITSNNPSSRANDQIIQLHDGWNVDYSAAYLQDGSITNSNGELWAGIKSIGYIDENTVPLINGKKALRPGHVNQCVKTNPGEEVTLQTRTPGMTYSEFKVKAGHGTTYAALCESSDIHWNNPEEDPLYKMIKDNNFGYYSNSIYPSSSKGMRKALNERNI